MDLFPLHPPKHDLWPLTCCTGKVRGFLYGISAEDVLDVLGYQPSHHHRIRKIKKYTASIIRKEIPTHVWNHDAQMWEPTEDEEECFMLVMSDDPTQQQVVLTHFATYILNKARKSPKEKKHLLSCLNCEAPLLETPIECDLLAFLQDCVPWKVELQYRIGSHRLDGYIAEHHLAIQIDENGHSGYDVQDEKKYDQLMQQHNLKVVRFNPDLPRPLPSQYFLVQEVIKATQLKHKVD